MQIIDIKRDGIIKNQRLKDIRPKTKDAVSVNNVQITPNIRIRIFKGGLRIYDVVTKLDKNIRRLFIMNLKNKLFLSISSVGITLSAFGIIHSEGTVIKTEVAGNNLPTEFSVKRDVA
ncbi:hypothetical protein, partial [Exiguobacterium sp. S22-S28]|uniref:hypothetical protein n=1 Tax=Exiguobacterium sp. S22-S28 TaxID=3342768 RepID=UPI00372D7A23